MQADRRAGQHSHPRVVFDGEFARRGQCSRP